MIVRKLSEVKGTEREVSATGWISHRLLLKHEKMGFSMHDTTIVEGAELHLHYKNHLEAVYCVGGKGTVEVVGTGKTYEIEDGTIYALDQHDKHILRAEKEMRMICVFNPPLTGAEVHDETGAYPADPDAAAG